MTMHDEWTDQLSDYLDGELSNEEREAMDAHLSGCAECVAVLNDLKRVVAQAQTIEPRPPQADLWAGIAGRIDGMAQEPSQDAAARVTPVVARQARQPRRIAFTFPQLAAAALVLMAVSGGMAWTLAQRSPEGLRRAAPASDAARVSNPVPFADGVKASADGDRVVPVGLADAQYDAAVTDLEKALKDGRGRLDASTIAIVEHNLQIIDLAIDQARQALVADPANDYLSGHLVEARRRKLDLLRRAAALTTETN